jgi:hypothetical protein
VIYYFTSSLCLNRLSLFCHSVPRKRVLALPEKDLTNQAKIIRRNADAPYVATPAQKAPTKSGLWNILYGK